MVDLLLAARADRRYFSTGLRGSRRLGQKDITAAEALEIAKSAKPAGTSVDAGDPSGLKAGRQISITPDDTGKVPVSGELVGLSADSISIARNDPRASEVVVHFPRAGFTIQPL